MSSPARRVRARRRPRLRIVLNGALRRRKHNRPESAVDRRGVGASRRGARLAGALHRTHRWIHRARGGARDGTTRRRRPRDGGGDALGARAFASAENNTAAAAAAAPSPPRKPPRKCSTTPRRFASGRTSRSSPFQMVCRTSRPARPCDYTRTARIARGRGRGMPMPFGTVGGPGRAALAVDHVRFWSRALTPVEIWSRRGALASGREPDLWSYLPLDEGCGAAVEDASAAAAAENRRRGISRRKISRGTDARRRCRARRSRRFDRRSSPRPPERR